MPSVLLGNPLASGGQIIVSGNPWSGRLVPQAGLNLRWVSSGGNAYISLSGGPPLSGIGINITSGGMFLSGLGLVDGMLLAPGDSYFIPKSLFQSGTYNVFAFCDAAASGIGRLYFEPDTFYHK